MESLIVYPQTSKQLKAIKAFMDVLEVKFEKTEKPYRAEFVAEVQASRQAIKEGKGVKMEIKDLWK